MTSLTRDEMRLAEEAAEWVTRLTVDSTQECREGLVAWLQRSAQNIDEFLLAQATFRAFHRVDPQRQIDVQELIAHAKSSIVPLRQIGADLDRHRTDAVIQVVGGEGGAIPSEVSSVTRRGLRNLWRTATAAAVIVLALAGVWRWVDDPDSRTYSTGLGEQRTIPLSDGSLVELNTRSKVDVNFSKGARRVQLLAGEALFVVAHDTQRPFRVSTGDATIQAVGTQFSVYLGDSGTRVAVVEGRIEITADDAGSASPNPVEGKGDLTFLTAGEEADVAGNGNVVKDAKPNVQNAIAWRQRRLVFDHTLLSDVVKQLSRYSNFKIRLIGDTLQNRHISGVFQADDPQTIVSLLESDASVNVEHVDRGVIITLKN